MLRYERSLLKRHICSFCVSNLTIFFSLFSCAAHAKVREKFLERHVYSVRVSNLKLFFLLFLVQPTLRYERSLLKRHVCSVCVSNLTLFFLSLFSCAAHTKVRAKFARAPRLLCLRIKSHAVLLALFLRSPR